MFAPVELYWNNMIHSTVLAQLALLDSWTLVRCLEHSKQNVFRKLDPFPLSGEKARNIWGNRCVLFGMPRGWTARPHALSPWAVLFAKQPQLIRDLKWIQTWTATLLPFFRFLPQWHTIHSFHGTVLPFLSSSVDEQLLVISCWNVEASFSLHQTKCWIYIVLTVHRVFTCFKQCVMYSTLQVHIYIKCCSVHFCIMEKYFLTSHYGTESLFWKKKITITNMIYKSGGRLFVCGT
jgi:hypothetical protein